MRVAAESAQAALEQQLRMDSSRESQSWSTALRSFLEAVKAAMAQVLAWLISWQ